MGTAFNLLSAEPVGGVISLVPVAQIQLKPIAVRKSWKRCCQKENI